MYQMLNLRFSEITQRPDAPFLGAGAGSQELAVTRRPPRLARAPPMAASPKDLRRCCSKRGARGIRLHRRRARPRQAIGAASYERAFAEREKTESPGYAREYIGNFLDDEPIPGIAYEYELTKALLPGITLAEVSAAARELLADNSRVVLATSPDKADVTLPSEADLRAVLTKAAAATLTPWTETLSRDGPADQQADARQGRLVADNRRASGPPC